MNTPQQPLHSGFGPQSTAADVMDGIDLTGKLAIVTGGYSGLGLVTTRALVDAGASVIVPARRVDVARAALKGIPRVTVEPLDLADLATVRHFAANFLATGQRIDLFFANAAIMANAETRVGSGWESQFATNHLGHFALVTMLVPALAPKARVVITSSRAHALHGMRWDDVHFTSGYERWQAYGQAKTANVLFAVELDVRLRDRGIRVFATHPGIIKTELQRHFTEAEQIESGWIDADGNVNPDFKSPEQGAATQLWAATSPTLDGHGGVYCMDCDVAPREGVAEWATDPEEALRLWDLSVELTGVDADLAVKEG